MKIKIFVFTILLFSIIYGQDEHQSLIVPYNVTGKTIITLPENVLGKEMKGRAIVTLALDDKCNLLSFIITSISLQNTDNDNILRYSNKLGYEDIFIRNISTYKCEWYPLYMRFLFDYIADCINKLQFIYSGEGLINKKNFLFIKIEINQEKQN